MIILILGLVLIAILVLTYISKKQRLHEEEKTREIDYNVYTLNFIEKIRYSLIAGLFLFLIGYLFYRSIILSLILAVLGVFYPRLKKTDLLDKRKNQLELEFKDALAIIYTSISAGTSPTNAIMQTKDELDRLYFDGNHYIVKEFEIMKQKLQMNERVEDVLQNFSDRAGLDSVSNFTDVFVLSMNTGGKQVEIIKGTINTIVEKIEIKREIDTMVAEKKFEAKIMNVMPFLIMAGLSLGAGDYLDPLFADIKGRMITTVVLILMGIAYLASQKIMKIEV